MIMMCGTGKVPEANPQAGMQLNLSDGRALSTYREEESLLFLMPAAAQSILRGVSKNQSNNDSEKYAVFHSIFFFIYNIEIWILMVSSCIDT